MIQLAKKLIKFNQVLIFSIGQVQFGERAGQMPTPFPRMPVFLQFEFVGFIKILMSAYFYQPANNIIFYNLKEQYKRVKKPGIRERLWKGTDRGLTKSKSN